MNSGFGVSSADPGDSHVSDINFGASEASESERIFVDAKPPSRDGSSGNSSIHSAEDQNRIDDRTVAEILERARKIEARVPERFGKYRVCRQIGIGQFGLVYEAIDEQLNRRVAIKAARDETCASEHLLERFTREALMGSRLDHPGIVPIYEINFDETGRLYIAMAYCESQTLDLWMESCRPILTHGLAVRLVMQILDAIDHGHQRGVIHRDIKPANIGVTDAHGQSSGLGIPTLRVLDFGLSCPLDSRERQTHSEAILGTPLYMAPEQAFSSNVTHHADLYSVGVVLYELLTGKVPFECDDRLEILERLRNEAPRSPESFDPTISSDLSAVVLKAMAKRPHQRYATAREFSEDLQRWLERKPTKARPRSLLTKLGSWADDSHRIGEAGIAMMALHLVQLIWATFGLIGSRTKHLTFSDVGFWTVVWYVMIAWLPLHCFFIALGWQMLRGRVSKFLMQLGLAFAVAATIYYSAHAFEILSPIVPWFGANPTAAFLLFSGFAVMSACDVSLLVLALVSLQTKMIDDAQRASLPQTREDIAVGEALAN